MPYCAKCRKITEMDDTNLEWKEAKNGSMYYIGFCDICGTKQSVFTDEDGDYFKGERTKEELIKKAKAAKKRKAVKIGYKVLDNDAKDCLRKCIRQKSKTTTLVSKPVSTQKVPSNVSGSKKRKLKRIE